FRELVKRPDVLMFDSKPLANNVTALGPITAEIYVSCDCPDFDLWVRLLDVAPDGTAFNLMSPGNDVLRASYREAQRGRQLLTPGQVYKLTLPNMRTGNVFAAGHRIRVQISGSFFPDFSRNPQNGELETTSARMRKAEIRIYHDREHPSRIVVPVVAE
ncbi:MAG TPA: CocE/NonD family hydrolase, partial [Terriglobales bacterium]|nr:CocE/NonD family hydrolase [Terriglobales bacterium]